jgi:hypothetical protein
MRKPLYSGGGFGANDINVYLDGDTLNPFASVVAPFDINNGDQLFAGVLMSGIGWGLPLGIAAP